MKVCVVFAYCQAKEVADDPARRNLEADLTAAAKEAEPVKDAGSSSSQVAPAAGSQIAAQGEGAFCRAP